VAFEQDLRTYLEGLDHESPAEAVSPPRHIDEHDLHRHFLDRLRELSKVTTPAVVEQRFDDWSKQLARFARFLEVLPRQLAPVDREGAIVFACRALDQALGCLEPGVPLVDRLELQRVVDVFVRDANVEPYALENKLVRGGRLGWKRLTELGRVFLRLRGKDAVRWLITAEVLQSSGASDRWHASHHLLEEAMSQRGGIITTWFFKGEMPAYNSQTVQRLNDLGVLSAVEEGNPGEYYAAAAMRDVVQAVLEQGPWHTAIRALLDDERAVALPGSSASATEATIEQTKLIAHEVRNALIPVRHDIEALRLIAVEPSQQQRIEAAKQGVARVLDFVDAMVQMSELITEPPTRCEIGAVVDEALGWIDTGRRVVRLLAPDPLYVVAPRMRLARAISNIAGNALQATTATQPVRVSFARSTGLVRVAIDDGGPGVPPEDRARVFLEGVTMRKDGSGFGLAFARRVVEGALHGEVWCEDSDLGGARFVIEIPEASH
jgi:signal transduction histidine kinase